MSFQSLELDASLRTARQTQDQVDRLQQQVVALQLRNYNLEERLAESTGQDLEEIQRTYENVSDIKSIHAELEQREKLLVESQDTIHGLENETRRLTDELHKAQTVISGHLAEIDRREQTYKAELAKRDESAADELNRATNALAAQHDDALAKVERTCANAVQELALATENHRVEIDGYAQNAAEERQRMEVIHEDVVRDWRRHVEELTDTLRASQDDIEELEMTVAEKAAAVDEAMVRAHTYEQNAQRLGQHNRLLAFELEEKTRRLDTAIDKLDEYKRYVAGYRLR